MEGAFGDKSGYWEGTKPYTQLDHYRDFFRLSNAQTVHRALDVLGLLDRNRRVLEIGSGIGELGNLLGESWSHAIQSEPNEAALQKNPNGVFKRWSWRHFEHRDYLRKAAVDAHNLPFKDNSLDAVVGFACLDVVEDPMKALASAYRVVKPGGFMVHFLDIIPDPKHLLPFAFARGELMFPFAHEHDPLLSSYVTIENTDNRLLNGVMKELNIPTSGLSPFETYSTWYRSMILNPNSLRLLHQYMGSKFKGVETKQLGDLGTEVLRTQITDAGFNVRQADWIATDVLMPRSAVFDGYGDDPDLHLFVSERGTPRPYSIGEPNRLPEGMIVARGQVQVVLAQKPRR